MLLGESCYYTIKESRQSMKLKENVRSSIIEIAQRHNISRVILFGSRARGDNRERSDIDLAVSGGDYVRFSLDVDEETPTLLRYDIVNLDTCKQKELLESIRQEGILLYEKG